jgi:hypothetical protein
MCLSDATFIDWSTRNHNNVSEWCDIYRLVVASLRHIIMIPCRPVYKCRTTQTHYYDSVSTSLWMLHHSDTLLWFHVDQSMKVASLRHIIMIPCRPVYESRITQTHYYDSVSTSLNVASLRHTVMIPCRPVYESRITQAHYYDSVSTSLWMSHHSDTLLWFRVDQSMTVASLSHIIMIPRRTFIDWSTRNHNNVFEWCDIHRLVDTES